MTITQEIHQYLLEQPEQYFTTDEIALGLNRNRTQIQGCMTSMLKKGRVKQEFDPASNRAIYKGLTIALKYNKNNIPPIKLPKNPKPPVSKDVLDFVYENPDCTRKDVEQHFQGVYARSSVFSALNRAVNQGTCIRKDYIDPPTYIYATSVPKQKIVKEQYISKPEVSNKSHDVISSIADLITESEGAKSLLINIRDQINQFLGEDI